MLFNSYEFLFAFLPVVLAGFFLIHRFSRRLALAWVTASSLVFYRYRDYLYLALILPSRRTGKLYALIRHRSG